MGVSTDAILVFGISLPEGSDGEQIINCVMENEENWQRLEKLQRKIGAEVVEHCSSGYPMYMIGVKLKKAWRGQPVAIDLAKLKATQKDVKAIRALCAALEVPFDAKKCKWWLCSHWSGGDG